MSVIQTQRINLTHAHLMNPSTRNIEVNDMHRKQMVIASLICFMFVLSAAYQVPMAIAQNNTIAIQSLDIAMTNVSVITQGIGDSGQDIYAGVLVYRLDFRSLITAYSVLNCTIKDSGGLVLRLAADYPTIQIAPGIYLVHFRNIGVDGIYTISVTIGWSTSWGTYVTKTGSAQVILNSWNGLGNQVNSAFSSLASQVNSYSFNMGNFTQNIIAFGDMIDHQIGFLGQAITSMGLDNVGDPSFNISYVNISPYNSAANQNTFRLSLDSLTKVGISWTMNNITTMSALENLIEHTNTSAPMLIFSGSVIPIPNNCNVSYWTTYIGDFVSRNAGTIGLFTNHYAMYHFGYSNGTIMDYNGGFSRLLNTTIGFGSSRAVGASHDVYSVKIDSGDVFGTNNVVEFTKDLFNQPSIPNWVTTNCSTLDYFETIGNVSLNQLVGLAISFRCLYEWMTIPISYAISNSVDQVFYSPFSNNTLNGLLLFGNTIYAFRIAYLNLIYGLQNVLQGTLTSSARTWYGNMKSKLTTDFGILNFTAMADDFRQVQLYQINVSAGMLASFGGNSTQLTSYLNSTVSQSVALHNDMIQANQTVCLTTTRTQLDEAVYGSFGQAYDPQGRKWISYAGQTWQITYYNNRRLINNMTTLFYYGFGLSGQTKLEDVDGYKWYIDWDLAHPGSNSAAGSLNKIVSDWTEDFSFQTIGEEMRNTTFFQLMVLGVDLNTLLQPIQTLSSNFRITFSNGTSVDYKGIVAILKQVMTISNLLSSNVIDPKTGVAEGIVDYLLDTTSNLITLGAGNLQVLSSGVFAAAIAGAVTGIFSIGASVGFGVVGYFMYMLIGWIRDRMVESLNAVKGIIGSIFGVINSVIKIMQAILSGVITGLKSLFYMIGGILTNIKTTLQSLFGQMGQTLNSLGSYVHSGFEAIKNWTLSSVVVIKSSIQGIIDRASSFLSILQKVVSSAGIGFFAQAQSLSTVVGDSITNLEKIFNSIVGIQDLSRTDLFKSFVQSSGSMAQAYSSKNGYNILVFGSGDVSYGLSNITVFSTLNGTKVAGAGSYEIYDRSLGTVAAGAIIFVNGVSTIDVSALGDAIYALNVTYGNEYAIAYVDKDSSWSLQDGTYGAYIVVAPAYADTGAPFDVTIILNNTRFSAGNVTIELMITNSLSTYLNGYATATVQFSGNGTMATTLTLTAYDTNAIDDLRIKVTDEYSGSQWVGVTSQSIAVNSPISLSQLFWIGVGIGAVALIVFLVWSNIQRKNEIKELNNREPLPPITVEEEE